MTLCLTGNERSVDALAERLSREPEAFHEVRLDLLERPDEARDLLAQFPPHQLLVCLRSERQGGGYRGDEGERIEKLAQSSARYVDVEADVSDDALDRLSRERVVLSWHDADPAGAGAKLTEMEARGCALVKLASQVEDAVELAHLYGVSLGCRHVVIGMGAAGQLSRARYGAFGSAWSYVPLRPEDATAPGQIDLPTAHLMGLPEAAGAPYLALVGGPQIAKSPGIRTYNPLLRRRRSALSYLAIQTGDLATLLPLLEATGCVGLSVTMPLKDQALALADGDALARRLGAANTLWPAAKGGWQASNTDVAGIEVPLSAHVAAPARALVLGAGGAARAARAACENLGLAVRLAARRGGDLGWAQRADDAPDVLINATPALEPWPADAPLPPLVFDTAIGVDNGLAARAAASGAIFLGPEVMWRHQGARQLSLFLGEAIAATDLLPSTAATP